MKSALFFFLLPLSAMAASDGSNWICEPPAGLFSYEKRTKSLGTEDIFEIPASKFDAVNLWYLSNAAIKSLDIAKANELTGGHYRCPDGKRPYLVRALFTAGDTGGFELYPNGKQLFVLWAYLGSEATPLKTALIVNLDFEPKQVFVAIGATR